MNQTKPIPVQTAVDFNAVHWPPHNRRQGIDWKQEDFALGAFYRDECLGVAIYKVVGGMASSSRSSSRKAQLERG